MTEQEVTIFDDLIEVVLTEERLRNGDYDSKNVYSAVMLVLGDEEVARRREAEAIYREAMQ